MQLLKMLLKLRLWSVDAYNGIVYYQKIAGRLLNDVGKAYKMVGRVQKTMGVTLKIMGRLKKTVDNVQIGVGSLQNTMEPKQNIMGEVQMDVCITKQASVGLPVLLYASVHKNINRSLQPLSDVSFYYLELWRYK